MAGRKNSLVTRRHLQQNQNLSQDRQLSAVIGRVSRDREEKDKHKRTGPGAFSLGKETKKNMLLILPLSVIMEVLCLQTLEGRHSF